MEVPGTRDGTFAILCPGHLANATTDLMKLDHEEEPQLSEPYLSKQKKLMVSVPTCWHLPLPLLFTENYRCWLEVESQLRL